MLYDRKGEEHYNTISALHKSIRASDETASLYWLARMLESGEDPLFIARRLVRAASEDVGNRKCRIIKSNHFSAIFAISLSSNDALYVYLVLKIQSNDSLLLASLINFKSNYLYVKV